jgi:N-acetylmuramoyl-L-alanine amidase
MLSAISRATAGNRQTSAAADRRSRTSPRAIACAALSCLAALAWLATMETAPALAGKPATPCPSAPVRVLVDIGHTPERFGATSSRGAREFDFNKRFAEEFIDYARNDARIAPRLLSPGNLSVSLAERIALANSGDADVFLSIHHDSAQRHLLTPWVHEGQPGLRTDTIGGFSLFVSRENPRFADSLALAMEIGRRLRGTVRGREAHAPARRPHRSRRPGQSGRGNTAQ